ncbi:glutamate racemase [Paraliomyxa miuraensis]|uniref:glutamate racemase n=1 Tax=Paraliomyxa miuraensis TaxID=376150 RepID=UPI002257CAFC|nr:glutamate racemase [Paraliomyxa miuraensis]MCX4239840.1 glutamate racemase [Paraliomyxa miuraensis]
MSAPIGVFDSGVGGLTVLAALRAHLPHESFVYLGDTARLPYGTKSPHTVSRYAQQAAQVLVDRGVKLLVIACNTASAVALDDLRQHLSPLPVVGVVEPGAAAACEASSHGRIAVIGTESTIRGRAYERAIARRRPEASVVGRPCPLFVALAEEGWCEGPIPEAVAQRYLGDLRPVPNDPASIDCLVLGCTHFPVLRPALAAVMGPGVALVDSAETTAAAVAHALEGSDLAAPVGATGSVTLLATDGPERFARVGSGFLGLELSPDAVSLVDL